MKIDNLQIPKGYSKKEASKSKETAEDFSKVLSGTMATNKESNVKEDIKVDKKVVDLNTEEIDVEDDTMESINPLLMFVNMPLFEDEVTEVNDLGLEQLVDISSINPIVSSLEVNDTMNIVDTNLINVKSSESFVVEEIIIDAEILVDRTILVNDEATNLNGRNLQDETNLAINSGNRVIDNTSKYVPKDKELSIDNEFTPVNEGKEINLEELIKIEDLGLTKPMDDEVLDIKKDETIVVTKWINHNLEGTQKVNLANEVDGQAKVISNENIQNINDSIIQLMETTTEGNTNVMKVQLYPEELGAVNITLKMENGKLIAKILVDDDYVKQLFTGKIELLNNNLAKQNVNMESIFVELNNSANSNPNGNSDGNNNNFSRQNNNLEFTSESLDGTTIEETDLGSSELSILA